MADNVWLLNDSTPTDIGQQFAAPASPSTLVYWGGLASLQFAAGGAMQDGTATPPGVSATSALGAVVATGGALEAVNGVAATSTIGTATASGAAQASPSGVAAVGAIGGVLARGDAFTAASGVSAVASVGSAVARGGAATQPAGVAAVSTVGQATAIGESGGAATASPLGVAAMSAVGAATVTGGAVVLTLGVSAISAVGTATAYDADAIPPVTNTGGFVRRATRTGRVISLLVVDAVADPMGVAARAAVGQARGAGTGLVQPTGLVGESELGDVRARGIRNLTDEDLLAVLWAA